MPALCEVIPRPEDPTKGKLRFNFHPGQLRAWYSKKRFILVLAGTQGGKTSFGPAWLWREIQRRGPGDYMVVTPTYPLLVKKALPEFLRLFKRQLRLGDYSTQQKVFTFSDAGQVATFGRIDHDNATQVFFGHASDSESLESATAKAVWMDEAGQKKFRIGSWEAIQRRLSIHEGRALITTTPYDLGWLKQLLWDPWKAAKQNHPVIDVVRFDSTANPAFPKREFDRARAMLPPWKFDLFYRAIFTRPAGLIYGSFNEDLHVIPRFEIPPEWQRFVGVDFGPVNTAAIFYAEERAAAGRKTIEPRPGEPMLPVQTAGSLPTGRLIAYREYKPGEKSIVERCKALMQGEPRIPTFVGGSMSEDRWRREFGKGGLLNGKQIAGIPIKGPATAEVEVGIDRVYAAHARGEILVFDDLRGYLDEKLAYSRELNEMGEPTDEIDEKEIWHIMDAERYILGWLKDPGRQKGGFNPSGIVARQGYQR